MKCQHCRGGVALDTYPYCEECLNDDLTGQSDPDPLTITVAEIVRERERVARALDRCSNALDARWRNQCGRSHDYGITSLTMRQARRVMFRESLAGYADWLEDALCSAEEAELWHDYYFAAVRYQVEQIARGVLAELAAEREVVP